MADSIAEIAWYIGSKGLIAAAEHFTDDVYDFLVKLSDSRRSHAICRDPISRLIGYECVSCEEKYTIVFLEIDQETII